MNISFFWSCFPIFLLFSVNICASFFKLILQWFIGKSRMKINSLQQRYLLQNRFILTFIYHLNALKMMKIESPFSAGKQLKVRCGSSFLKNFFSKGWELQAEVILFQKQPPSVFHGKAINKAEKSVVKLNGKNKQWNVPFSNF